MKKLLIGAMLASSVFAECVDERILPGMSLDSFKTTHEVRVEVDGKFLPLNTVSVNPLLNYSVQLLDKKHRNHMKTNGDFSRYNKKYIEYYTYPRMEKYISLKEKELSAIEYEIKTIGKSLEGRDLFYIGPKVIDPNMKTIVMFGRHHGDEGTANWIIEGYLNEYLKSAQNEKFQLILYPMINPDGAMAQTRYNKNNYDLNRTWSKTSGIDETKYIHEHLRTKIKGMKNIVIALDMHGSFEQDFFYRVDAGFAGRDFFDMQSKFINRLALYDPWQAGNTILSNGHPKMARIVLIRDYKLHALTHETIRNIPKRNRRGRDKDSLIEQGEAIVKTIADLY
jgi:hypothetical protein